MTPTPRTDAQVRAEWLCAHKAPADWLILTGEEIGILESRIVQLEHELAAMTESRDAIQAVRIATERDLTAAQEQYRVLAQGNQALRDQLTTMTARFTDADKSARGMMKLARLSRYSHTSIYEAELARQSKEDHK